MVFRDDKIGDTQTQAGAHAHRFGGQKRFEHPFPDRFIHARTVVFDLHYSHPSLGLESVSDENSGEFHSRLRQGLGRVAKYIEQHLLDFGPLARYGQEAIAIDFMISIRLKSYCFFKS